MNWRKAGALAALALVTMATGRAQAPLNLKVHTGRGQFTGNCPVGDEQAQLAAAGHGPVVSPLKHPAPGRVAAPGRGHVEDQRPCPAGISDTKCQK